MLIMSVTTYFALDTQSLPEGDGYLLLFKYFAIVLFVIYMIKRSLCLSAHRYLPHQIYIHR